MIISLIKLLYYPFEYLLQLLKRQSLCHSGRPLNLILYCFVSEVIVMQGKSFFNDFLCECKIWIWRTELYRNINWSLKWCNRWHTGGLKSQCLNQWWLYQGLAKHKCIKSSTVRYHDMILFTDNTLGCQKRKYKFRSKTKIWTFFESYSESKPYC